MDIQARDEYNCMLTPGYIAYNRVAYNSIQMTEEQNYLKGFAENVKRKRELQGLSQEKLAERAELHRTYIGMVERMERNPSLVSVYKIAKGLGTDIKELV